MACYDFAQLPVAEGLQRSLARVFAARCSSNGWASHRTSEGYWLPVRSFASWLAGLPAPPTEVAQITAAIWDAWRISRPATVGGQQQVTRVAALLLNDEHLSRSAAEVMARRMVRPRRVEESYQAGDFDQIKVAARRMFRSAVLRIEDNAAHLERWRGGAFEEGSREWLVGEALECLARTADVPSYPRAHNGTRRVRYRYLRALGGESGACTWQRLFLSRDEAVALGVLLMAEFGWNLSVIDTLAVPRATPDADPDEPTYRLELVKRRRGSGRHHETRNVTDHGAGSGGRLITQSLRATRFARAIVEDLAPGTDRLLVWRTTMPHQGQDNGVGPLLRMGISGQTLTGWGRVNGAGGSPFRRGRRTVQVVRGEPLQNTQDTHDRVYVLSDPQTQRATVPLLADGAESALRHAQQAVLVAQLRDQADPGDVPTATADCTDPDHGPFPAPGGGCGASFLMCLGCTNAHIHPGHHSRLAHLHHALGNLRSAMSPRLWQSDWADAHTRLEDLRERLGPATWAQALSRVTDVDRALVGGLLTGALDA
ncbi:hypothetical protein [Actinoallomurus vinaceus]|uniref:hypothetical protein n=1 Tax=Actinoallomurus vinaceus TaxID=1080074 RepID=UPI0031F103F0